MKRKICVVTGSRAEYGLLKPLMDEIRKDRGLLLQITVTGMHLSAEFGNTHKEIEKDGFKINRKVGIGLYSDTAAGLTRSMANAMTGLSAAYRALRPDIIVVLGDRFEIFSAAAAALIHRIPVAHIHGGEVTRGAFDDALRHSITKMSYLHFTSAEIYRKRVIQLGESPYRVFNVGAIGLDNIRNLKLLSRSSLEQELGFRFNRHNLLVAFHPVTLENDTARSQFKTILATLHQLKETNLIFTKANADTGGRAINRLMDEYTAKNRRTSIAFASMGQLRFLSTLQYVDAIVGNSSSGILEAPSFRIGTVNIGDRQTGRIKPSSVIDCSPSEKGLQKAFRLLYSEGFQKRLKHTVNPYGAGRTSPRIKRILSRFRLPLTIKKDFYDINF
jgi:GDP/UDP-N,N'-diacetylbacillosamine 2-epimerase (hydrolysing)